MEKTKEAEYVDEYFLGRIRWVTLVPGRQPKYKAHKSLGVACSALGFRANCVTYGYQNNGAEVHEMDKGSKLFYASNVHGFLEVELPEKWEGSLTKHLTPIINKQLGEL